MNKKGFTIIELISAFTLTSLIMVLLFEVVFIIKDIYTTAGIKTDLLSKQAIISEKINDELMTKTINVAAKCGENCVNFSFSDGTSSQLIFDREKNEFKYGNYKTKLISGSQYGNIEIGTETILNVGQNKNDSIVKIQIPIYHKLLKKQDFGINIAYQYDSRNTALSGLFISDVLDKEKRIYLIGSQNDVSFSGIKYNDPGYFVISGDGNITADDPAVIITGQVGTEIGKTYPITYTILDSNDNIMDKVVRNVTIINSENTFNYTGNSQQFIPPVNGNYKIELWGAQGGTTGQFAVGGKGGYTSGELNLTKTDKIYVYVGGQGQYQKNKSMPGGFGGGGASGYGSENSGGSGGGASDIRINNQNASERKMIAGGGGGAGSRNDSTDLANGGAGGGLNGLIGSYSTASYNGQPGTNTTFGLQATFTTDVTVLPTAGNNLGIGGIGGSYKNTYGGGGGGGGWFAGGGGVRYGTGGGGSGYCGTSSNCTTYNGTQSFLSNNGTTFEVGHTGNGIVKITLISIIN